MRFYKVAVETVPNEVLEAAKSIGLYDPEGQTVSLDTKIPWSQIAKDYPTPFILELINKLQQAEREGATELKLVRQ